MFWMGWSRAEISHQTIDSLQSYLILLTSYFSKTENFIVLPKTIRKHFTILSSSTKLVGGEEERWRTELGNNNRLSSEVNQKLVQSNMNQNSLFQSDMQKTIHSNKIRDVRNIQMPSFLWIKHEVASNYCNMAGCKIKTNACSQVLDLPIIKKRQ